MNEWEVLMKGSLAERCWELSVIKKDNGLGHDSYGWGGLTKIVLFSNQIIPWVADERLWNHMTEMANKVCKGLNE